MTATWYLFAACLTAVGAVLLTLFVLEPPAGAGIVLAALFGIASLIIPGGAAAWVTYLTRQDHCVVSRDHVEIFVTPRQWASPFTRIRRIEWFHTVEGGRGRATILHSLFILKSGERVRFEGALVYAASRRVAEQMIAAGWLDPEDAFQDGRRSSAERV